MAASFSRRSAMSWLSSTTTVTVVAGVGAFWAWLMGLDFNSLNLLQF
jgi:hypothetical protein